MNWRVFALTAMLAGPVYAQGGDEASIEGIVTDSTGGVIVAAGVTARHLETSTSFHATTDQRGMFRFAVVPAGTYEVTADGAGLATFVQRNVPVAVGAKIDLRVVLRVRTHEESVTVGPEAPPVEATRTSFSSTVDRQAIANLPLNGRNVLSFIQLAPGVTSGAFTLNGGFFSVAGQSSMNSLLIDGADHNGFTASPVGSALANRYLVGQEAVQEFQVNTASYSAEFGRAGTAVVNVITKSGTNEAQGSAFWYYRDDSLSAIGPITKLTGATETPFQGHQFGGALGGPVLRDRLFFYLSYDGQRRSEWNPTLLNLPSGFTLSPDPAVAGFEQAALDYLRARAGPYGRTFEQNVVFGKLDWHAGGNHLLRGSWNRHRFMFSNTANAGAQQSLEHTGPSAQLADTVTATLTSLLGPRNVNVTRFSYVANHDPQGANAYLPEAAVFEGQQVLLVGRSARLPVDTGVRRVEWSDILSLSRGLHAIKFGGNLLVERARFFSALNFYGSYRFASLEKFGRSLARASGMAERYTQAFSAQGTPPIDVHPEGLEAGAFVQDTWHVRPSLTLDLGLRYEAEAMRQSAVRNPSPALAAAGVDTSFLPKSHNLAPRFGFAWSPSQGRRVVVRGGYGLYFPRFLPGTAARILAQNGITVQTRTFTGASVPAYPDTICGAPDPSGDPPRCSVPMAGRDTIMAVPGSYRSSVIRQGSLGAEVRLAKGAALSVTYLRVKGDRLMHWQDINLGQPVLATIGIAGTETLLTYRRYPAARPIADFDRVLLLNANARSSYHGIAVHLNQRFSRGVQLTASYTLGKAIDDNPTLGALNPGPGDGGLLSDSLIPSLDRGSADFSQRHRLVVSGIWDLRYGGALPQPAKAILTGWQISGILLADSGLPYSGNVSFDLNNDGNAATDRTPGLPRNSFVLPSTVSLDLRLTRRVELNGRFTLELSCDAFNAFNRFNVSAVSTTQFSRSISASVCGVVGSPCLVPQTEGVSAFGTPTAALNPRMMQVSVRLLFHGW